MKLQHKLTLFNTVTKMAIICLLGTLLLVFTDRISVHHLQKRLIDKRDKLISSLSEAEIDELLQKEASFTDYNILKEEYIVLTEVDPAVFKRPGLHFAQDKREIDGVQQEYIIVTDGFIYNGRAFNLEIGETMEAVNQLEDTILYFTLVVLVVAIVISLFVDFAFINFLLSPFYKIIDQKLNRVNDPSHYNYAPTATSTDDFKLLDESIGALMKKISDLFVLEKQFISNISHELLTPVSVLRTRMENMLADESLSADNQNRIIASLKTLSRLKSVVNSLLLISKVENRQFSITDTVPIRALVDDIYEELEDRVLEKHLTFRVTMTEEVSVLANRALLHTLVMNLVNNALKYTPPQGEVVLSDSLSGQHYLLVIADNGRGMDELEVQQAFNRFEKLSSEREDSHGLGLAIVKSIADFHGIGVTISSEKGQGTRVALSFTLQ